MKWDGLIHYHYARELGYMVAEVFEKTEIRKHTLHTHAYPPTIIIFNILL
jgi:hypothetical protein